MGLLKQSVVRYLLSLARTFTPVLTIGNSTYIFRNADVREILLRDQDFTIEDINGRNIRRAYW